MRTPVIRSKITGLVGAILLLLAVITACTAAPTTSEAAPVQPTIFTQVVTRLVTQAVTQEVTRIVQVPITMTPAPSWTPTPTPESNTTVTPGLPQALLPQYTDCLHGPADYFTYKTSFPAGQVVEVVGRSEDSGWLNIEEVGGWNSCWVPVGLAQLLGSRVGDLPVAGIIYPRSVAEFGSPYVTVHREGDEVTVSWEAVYMSADEVRGYLIDAYVCQGGQYLHKPIFIPETYASNTGTISTTIVDEAGCDQPSQAHIVSMGLRGFAEWEKIFWPPR